MSKTSDRRSGYVPLEPVVKSEKDEQPVNNKVEPEKAAEPKAYTQEELKKMLFDGVMASLKTSYGKIDEDNQKNAEDIRELKAGQRDINEKLSKIEKSVSSLTAAPGGTATRSEPSDWDRMFPKTVTPHHVAKAFLTRIGSGKEILRYIEEDAIRIANTEDPGKEHKAYLIFAWAAEDGLLIRPLSPDESEKYRKM